MKIQWLDTERRRGHITRGLLWWRRETVVVYNGDRCWWKFEASSRSVPTELHNWIENRRDAANEKDRRLGHDADWQRPASLPRAEVRS